MSRATAKAFHAQRSPRMIDTLYDDLGNTGTGSPQGIVAAPPGSVYRQTNDAALGYLKWYKASGTGSTGWLPDFEGRWVSYTPTVTGWTLGSGTAEGHYTRAGKTVTVRCVVTLSGTTVAGSLNVSLPVTAVRESIGSARAFDVLSNSYLFTARARTDGLLTVYGIGTNGVTLSVNATTPFTWANGDFVIANATYEIA